MNDSEGDWYDDGGDGASFIRSSPVDLGIGELGREKVNVLCEDCGHGLNQHDRDAYPGMSECRGCSCTGFVKQKAPHVFKPCCEKDSDGDGNCHLHYQVRLKVSAFGQSKLVDVVLHRQDRPEDVSILENMANVVSELDWERMETSE